MRSSNTRPLSIQYTSQKSSRKICPCASGTIFLVERESWQKEEWTSLVIVQRETGRGHWRKQRWKGCLWAEFEGQEPQDASFVLRSASLYSLRNGRTHNSLGLQRVSSIMSTCLTSLPQRRGLLINGGGGGKGWWVRVCWESEVRRQWVCEVWKKNLPTHSTSL